MESPEEIIKEYDLGIVRNIVPLQGGIINKTWRVETDFGIYILQKVNDIYSPLVMEDLMVVQKYLGTKGFLTAEIIKTIDGNLYVNKKGLWRLFTYINGKTYNEVTDPHIAYEAGIFLGKFHRSLNDFKYDFIHRREIVNNIPLLYKKFKDAVVKNISKEIDAIVPTVETMRELQLPSHLRNTINHGDPKISNFIFNNSSPTKVITMIDLDDCGKNYNVLYELADAFCSWSWDHGNNIFDLQIFEAGLKGYIDSSHGFITREEWSLLPQALKLHLLQLISRFIRDYFEDSYFEWDPVNYKSRKEHNLARAQKRFALYKDVCSRETEIKKIIEKTINFNI